MGKKSRARIALGDDGSPLNSNPFGALEDQFGAEAVEDDAESNVVEAIAKSDEARPYRIERTRKGALPNFVEKRAKGKMVTVVRNVSGDGEALLTLLKKSCGAGGVAREGEVEIQGDQRAKVEKILRESRKYFETVDDECVRKD